MHQDGCSPHSHSGPKADPRARTLDPSKDASLPMGCRASLKPARIENGRWPREPRRIRSPPTPLWCGGHGSATDPGCSSPLPPESQTDRPGLHDIRGRLTCWSEIWWIGSPDGSCRSCRNIAGCRHRPWQNQNS